MSAPAIASREPNTGKTRRQLYIETWGDLVNERSSWLDSWRELAEYILPWRFRFTDSDANKGGRKDAKIVNFAPRRAAGVLAAGMMAGITSPARRWFRLSTADPRLAETPAVRSWLALVEQRMGEILLRSNLYSCLHNVYLDLGTPGTAALYIEEDEEDIVRGYVFLAGSYALANSARLAVNQIYRQFRMTVGQLVEKFGLANCGQQVKQAYESNRRNEWVRVLHIIEPNTDADARYYDNGKMAFRSVWLELDRANDNEIGFLREGGYEEFPACCPRWATTGEDVYGSDSPGMVCIGEVKALQTLKKEKLKGVEKMITPPMKAPASLRNERVSFIAGDCTFGDSSSVHDKLEPAQVVEPAAIEQIRTEEREAVSMIDAAYFVDLLLSVQQIDKSNATAEEIRARKQEVMMQLGPVLDRLGDELLDPLMDRVFAIALRRGVIPPPPEELAGNNLKIEYISILGQAQKQLGTTAIELMINFLRNVAEFSPETLDKADFDKMVEDYADMLGIGPDELHTDEEVEEKRAAREQRVQQQNLAEQRLAATQGAKNLASANLDGNNALSALLGSNSQVASAAAGQVAAPAETGVV